MESSDLGRSEKLCLAGIGASGLYYLALLPVAPSLLGKDPVLLELLRGTTPAMVAGGAFARVGQASLVLALLAPLITLVMSDPLFWWAGRLWGPKAAHVLAGQGRRGQRLTGRTIRLAERFRGVAVVLAYYLPVPSALIYAAAGWTGMSLRRFLVLDIIGAMTWIALNVGLGYAIGQRAVDVAKAISHYALIVTLALIVLIFVFQLFRARRDAAAEAS